MTDILIRVYPKVKGIGLAEHFVPRPETEKSKKKLLAAYKQAKTWLEKREVLVKYGQEYDFNSWCDVSFSGFLAHWNQYFPRRGVAMFENSIGVWVDEWFIERYMSVYDHQIKDPITGIWKSGNDESK